MNDTSTTSTKEKLNPGEELTLKALDDWAGVFKLQLGIGTGAIVLIVHAIVDGHLRPSLAALLTLAALCFCISAVASLGALTDLALAKARFWDSATRLSARRRYFGPEPPKDAAFPIDALATTACITPTSFLKVTT